MIIRLDLWVAGAVCLGLAGCSPPSEGAQDSERHQSASGAETVEIGASANDQAPTQQNDVPEFAQRLWERTVEIAMPCENAAAVLADRVASTSPENAKPDAQRGLRTCEAALTKQNALQVPEEADGDLAVTLDTAIHECREALDARKKFFEYSIMILEGDVSQARQSLVRTSSMVAQGRSEDCIARFREAGLEI